MRCPPQPPRSILGLNQVITCSVLSAFLAADSDCTCTCASEMGDENLQKINEKEMRRKNALICTLCPVCQSPFNIDSGKPKRLACSHLHCLKCSTIMFSQNQECIKCGICRGVTQIESGQSVDLSLESDHSFLELSIGYQEIHSDMVVMQEQLRVVRQERDEYLQQRNNLIDQQNQSMQDCVFEKAKPATSIEQQAGPSKSIGYRRNHVDVPSSSEENESEELRPKKAKLNLPLKFVPSKFSTPFHSPKAELQFRMKKNKALLSNGKLYTITLCGVPDLLKTPEPQELGALALIGLGQKKDISIPDGDGECIYKFLARLFKPLLTYFSIENAYLSVCCPKPGSGGGLKQKLFIFDPISGPNSEEFKAVGKKIFLVPFNANFDYVPPKPPTVKCNVCEELVDPMVMALHKASCGTGANGSDFFFYEEEE